MNIKLVILLAGFSMALFSCGETKQKSTENTIENSELNENMVESSFTETVWLLESIEGEKIIYAADKKQNYIVFKKSGDKKIASGYSGCNSFSGQYNSEAKEKLSFQRIASTRKACFSKEVMDIETANLAILEDVDSYKINGAELVLLGESIELAKYIAQKK
ncbi:MAG: META domain-containing protein [Ichthyobacteriaceae bacterium]|nr:META domain-containing protein [Ichthyobacteriaceae bacterium]